MQNKLVHTVYLKCHTEKENNEKQNCSIIPLYGQLDKFLCETFTSLLFLSFSAHRISPREVEAEEVPSPHLYLLTTSTL